ncbi:hypothetical protein, partial [Mesorhizobium sp.]|uniref:hypothetical protein n=1 Tax=Mesorhizobium sp. TaxID=1871066 RepID=UPI0025E15C6F
AGYQFQVDLDRTLLLLDPQWNAPRPGQSVLKHAALTWQLVILLISTTFRDVEIGFPAQAEQARPGSSP